MKRSALGRGPLAAWMICGIFGFAEPAIANDPAPSCRDGVLIGDRYCATEFAAPVTDDAAPSCRDGVLIGDRYCVTEFATPVTDDEAPSCRDGVLIGDRYCLGGSVRTD